MLKHYLLTLLLAALTCTLAGFAVAQDSGSAAPQSAPAGAPPEGHGHRGFDPERRTEMLTKQLKLTADQQPKVLDILKSQQSQMESLHSDSSLSQTDRRAKMMDIRKASDDQIRSLLDSDQQKKWDEMLSRREQWQGRRQGQDSGAPNPPQQQ